MRAGGEEGVCGGLEGCGGGGVQEGGDVDCGEGWGWGHGCWRWGGMEGMPEKDRCFISALRRSP